MFRFSTLCPVVPTKVSWDASCPIFSNVSSPSRNCRSNEHEIWPVVSFYNVETHLETNAFKEVLKQVFLDPPWKLKLFCLQMVAIGFLADQTQAYIK
ncbi:hypothetical protein QTP88_026513 [Uroleucon formosanum]